MPGSAAAREGVRKAMDKQNDVHERMVARETAREHMMTVVQGGRHQARPGSSVVSKAATTSEAAACVGAGG